MRCWRLIKGGRVLEVFTTKEDTGEITGIMELKLAKVVTKEEAFKLLQAMFPEKARGVA